MGEVVVEGCMDCLVWKNGGGGVDALVLGVPGGGGMDGADGRREDVEVV